MQKPPIFPVALRLRIEPGRSPFLGRDGFKWSIFGKDDAGEWVNYGRRWHRSLEEFAYGVGGWERTSEKAEKAARAEVDKICAYQCRRIAAYEEWQEKWERGFYEVDVECVDCG